MRGREGERESGSGKKSWYHDYFGIRFVNLDGEVGGRSILCCGGSAPGFAPFVAIATCTGSVSSHSDRFMLRGGRGRRITALQSHKRDLHVQ